MMHGTYNVKYEWYLTVVGCDNFRFASKPDTGENFIYVYFGMRKINKNGISHTIPNSETCV